MSSLAAKTITRSSATSSMTARFGGLSTRSTVAKRKIGIVRLGRAVRVPATEIARLVEQGSVPAARPRD